MTMGGMGLAWLPFTTASLLPFNFLITYVWSVVLGHTEPDFPYISSTGTYPPESCFFGQLLNITALLMGLLVYVRREVVADYCRSTGTHAAVLARSRVSSYFGYVASFGISMVGNFQATNFLSLHLVGAFCAFGIGNIYIWIEAVLSLSLAPRVNSTWVAYLRLATAAVASVMGVLSVTFSGLHYQHNKDVAYWTADPSWQRERIAWGYHVAATGCEWVLAGCFYIVLMSFVPDMKRVRLQRLVVEVQRDRKQVRQEAPSAARSNDTLESERL